jgi:SAM-dependent methyltransferase
MPAFIDIDRPRLRPARTHHGYRHLALLAAQLEAELSRAQPGITVDLGSGSEPYRPLVPGRYIGLDLTTAHGVPSAVARAEQTPLRSSCADVVLSTQQLEHVDEPSTVLTEARRILRPGGTLLLSTHGIWSHHPDPHDLWRWTEEGLVRIVEQAGFGAVRVHRQGELFSAALMLGSYPIGGLRRRGGIMTRTVAGALLFLVNALCGPLDALLARSGLRHYASPSYLVVGTREH